MKKLLLYSLTLVGMLVSSTQSAVAQLTNPDYKEIKSATGVYYFYTTPENLANAFNNKWAADGTKKGTFSPNTSSKTALNPENESTTIDIANKSVIVKDSKEKIVFLYVKGITALKIYGLGGSSDRKMTVELTNNGTTTNTQTETFYKNKSGNLEIPGLLSTNEYTIKITTNGDMYLYCIKFTGTVDPNFVDVPEIFDNDGEISISCEEGATIKYSIDGTTPSITEGLDYNAPFTLTESAIVKAIAIKNGYTSEVFSKSITIIRPVDKLYVCTFLETPNNEIIKFSGCTTQNCKPVTIDGFEYTKAWKVQSGNGATFKTSNPALLKIVFTDKESANASSYKIKVDGESVGSNAPNIAYKVLEAGNHSIERDGESMIAYIGVFENYSTISNDISTMYYDYPVSLADGLTAYTGTVNGNSVSLTAIEGNVVKANTPVIVKASAAGTYYINESNVTGAGEAGSLSGTATALTVDPNTHYTLGHKDGDANAEIGFYKFSGTTIPANKAYIDGATVNGAPIFLSIDGDGNTTGIHDTMIDNADVDAPMFNIAGQRVGNNAKGLVIKNGKKYMLK